MSRLDLQRFGYTGVGTEQARVQAVGCVRDGGHRPRRVSHGELSVNDLFRRNVGVKGGPCPLPGLRPNLEIGAGRRRPDRERS